MLSSASTLIKLALLLIIFVGAYFYFKSNNKLTKNVINVFDKIERINSDEYIYKPFKICNNKTFLKYNLNEDLFYFSSDPLLDSISFILTKNKGVVFILKNMIFDFGINDDYSICKMNRRGNIEFEFILQNNKYYLVLNKYLFLDSNMKYCLKNNIDVNIEFIN